MAERAGTLAKPVENIADEGPFCEPFHANVWRSVVWKTHGAWLKIGSGKFEARVEQGLVVSFWGVQIAE